MQCPGARCAGFPKTGQAACLEQAADSGMARRGTGGAIRMKFVYILHHIADCKIITEE